MHITDPGDPCKTPCILCALCQLASRGSWVTAGIDSNHTSPLMLSGGHPNNHPPFPDPIREGLYHLRLQSVFLQSCKTATVPLTPYWATGTLKGTYIEMTTGESGLSPGWFPSLITQLPAFGQRRGLMGALLATHKKIWGCSPGCPQHLPHIPRVLCQSNKY